MKIDYILILKQFTRWMAEHNLTTITEEEEAEFGKKKTNSYEKSREVFKSSEKRVVWKKYENEFFFFPLFS